MTNSEMAYLSAHESKSGQGRIHGGNGGFIYFLERKSSNLCNLETWRAGRANFNSSGRRVTLETYLTYQQYPMNQQMTCHLICSSGFLRRAVSDFHSLFPHAEFLSRTSYGFYFKTYMMVPPLPCLVFSTIVPCFSKYLSQSPPMTRWRCVSVQNVLMVTKPSLVINANIISLYFVSRLLIGTKLLIGVIAFPLRLKFHSGRG